MTRPIVTDKLSLVASLASEARRQEAARQLAVFYDAEDLIVFVRDQDVGIFLPAAGFQKQLKCGAEWQTFFQRCEREGRARAELWFAHRERRVPVLGVSACSNGILALVGAQSALPESDELLTLLPLLVWAFDTERSALASRANAALAREREMSAGLLAESLDKARFKLAAALVEANQARDALRAADRRKDEFLAMLAHELRNPLAPLGSGIELLKSAGERPELLPDIQEMMDKQLRQLARLVDDLMDVSRITRGKVALQLEAVSLQRILELSLGSVRPLVREKNQILHVSLPEQDIALHGDEARLAQVFANLLHNAVKYTDVEGRIALVAEASDTEVTVTVEDTGIGLDDQDLEPIFDVFVQIEHSTASVGSGLGLGLTLVKNLVERHGGRVSVRSAGRGTGSTFTVVLPRLKTTELLVPAVASPSSKSQVALEVLVVDDNEDSARSLAMLMRMLGHTAEVAFCGAEALTLADRLRPHLLLLDIGLPDFSGYAVCKRLRRMENCQNAIIVAQSGWGRAEDRQKAKEAGFDHFLVKPVAMDKLHSILDQAQAGQLTAQ